MENHLYVDFSRLDDVDMAFLSQDVLGTSGIGGGI